MFGQPNWVQKYTYVVIVNGQGGLVVALEESSSHDHHVAKVKCNTEE